VEVGIGVLVKPCEAAPTSAVGVACSLGGSPPASTVGEETLTPVSKLEQPTSRSNHTAASPLSSSRDLTPTIVLPTRPQAASYPPMLHYHPSLPPDLPAKR